MTAEHDRLTLDGPAWQRWGPYVSGRAWGTVREDYSADGNPWEYLPHDHARSRAYRWNEDGLAGICDDRQRLCFAVALWNGQDPILKERLFGLAGPEGNHGEDVKECYFYLDNTPSHSYMNMLYKYPQAAFPYRRLVEENRRRGKEAPEFELLDTGIFDEGRYFDVFVEYAKAAPDDLLIQISAVNRGPEAARLHVLPTLWFRNTWSWGRDGRRPHLRQGSAPSPKEPHLKEPHLKEPHPPSMPVPDTLVIEAQHHALGEYSLYCEGAAERALFTENETNTRRLFSGLNRSPYVKDAFHEYVVHGNAEAVNPEGTGTKAAVKYSMTIGARETATVRLRLTQHGTTGLPATSAPARGMPWNDAGPFAGFDAVFALRRREADEYYAALHPPMLDEDRRRTQRQALAGLLWSKQFYAYDVEQWLQGDPAQPPPPPTRRKGRNADWRHLNSGDVLSIPDTWEYPWFAAWDLAFHCVPLALVDSEFAKNQLVLLHREWYQHPNGEVPAYEWRFGDANPPVFAWAAWRVYKIEQKNRGGTGDITFLERIFHKLLLNFTWWVNRKDREGNNVFEGGFLGLDNIGVFDRSATLPTGGHFDQSDGTSWMAMFCLNMMTIALELACHNPVYEDIATKFFEHFMYIAAAMNNIGSENIALWDEQDEFFYDVLHLPDNTSHPLKVRSLVGLIPLLAVETVEPALLDKLPGFKERLERFLEHHPDLAQLVSRWHVPGQGERRLLALMRGHRMKRLLKRALDPAEFLSDHGIRSLSKYHAANPYMLHVPGPAGTLSYAVHYEPAESRSTLFGGNSNWRGPVWFPINYLLIEALQKFQHYYSDDFLVECPTGSGQFRTLGQIADELSERMIRLFLRNAQQQRPFHGSREGPRGGPHELQQSDPHWRDHLLFHEYFHGDTGAGLGASHQTGWTALVALLLKQQGERHARER